MDLGLGGASDRATGGGIAPVVPTSEIDIPHALQTLS